MIDDAGLEARVSALQKDKARLDWLCSNNYGCWGVGYPGGTCIETGGESFQGKTLREAIDEAMKGGGG